MKTILYLLFVVLILALGCSKDNSDNNEDSTEVIYGEYSYVYSNIIKLIFKNQEGEDLLNDSTENYLSEPQLYYLVDGVITKPQDYDPQISSETGTHLITESDPYELKCSLYPGRDSILSDNDGIQTGISINYLGFSGEITDTIKTQWRYNENTGSYSWRTAWINGEELSIDDGNTFTIIK